LLILFTFVSVSCGGGSGSKTGGNPPPPPPPPPPPINGQINFTEVTDASGISFAVGFSNNPGDSVQVPHFAGGVASGDYDNDGDVDLFVVRGDMGPNLLYRNDGNNIFSDVAVSAGLANTKSATENYRHSGPMFADIDGDDDLDLFLGGVLGDPCKIYANNGDGTFTDVTSLSGLEGIGAPQTISAAFGDYDLDGDLDLLLAHWGVPRSHLDPGDTEHLWRNESDATGIRFVSVSVEAGLSPSIISLPDPNVTPKDEDHTYAPSFVRLNDDLYPDIAMVADFNTSMIFINNQDGTFTNTTDVDVIIDASGMGSALGDYDNDGDLDWFVTSIYMESQDPTTTGNRLYKNDGGVFTDVTGEAGVADGGWGWATCFIDLDNDGHLDLYHTNGWHTDLGGEFTSDSSRAFVSDGQGGFVNQAADIGVADTDQGRGVVCSDFDRDGDIDIFLWSNETAGAGRLFRNDTHGHNYVRIRLNGLAPNTAATGARIKATIGGNTQMREIMHASNYISQNPTEQVFGLGTAAQIDSLIIEWPDGSVSDLGIVQANQELVVDQSGL
jgi:hypothetical protein